MRQALKAALIGATITVLAEGSMAADDMRRFASKVLGSTELQTSGASPWCRAERCPPRAVDARGRAGRPRPTPDIASPRVNMLVRGADQKVVNFEQILFANGRMLSAARRLHGRSRRARSRRRSANGCGRCARA
jgi:hypothetical protein